MGKIVEREPEAKVITCDVDKTTKKEEKEK